MKITKASVIYALICNSIVSTVLCLTATFVASKDVNGINFLINLCVGYGIATIIGIFFPLVDIGKKFTRLFHVKTDTFTNNRPYRYLAVFAITLVYFLFVSPALSALNYFLIKEMTPMECVMGWCKNALPLLLFGYATSIAADKFTYIICHKIDPSF